MAWQKHPTTTRQHMEVTAAARVALTRKQKPKSRAGMHAAPAYSLSPHAVPPLVASKASSMPRRCPAVPRLSSARASGPAWPLAGRRGTPRAPPYRSRSLERPSAMTMSTISSAAPSISSCSSETTAVVVEQSSPMNFSTIRSAPQRAWPNSKVRRAFVL